MNDARKRATSLAGKRILVTGATSGLGREVALQLALQSGAYVVATGRRAELLEELKCEVGASSGAIDCHVVDLLKTNDLDELITTLINDPIDGMILNAGITFPGKFETADINFYSELIQTNVTSNLRLILGLQETLGSRKGRIAIVASLGGLIPLPYQAVYAGSKAFMINFGQSIREEFKHKGITVSVFAPGGIATEMTSGSEFDHVANNLADARTVASQAIHAYSLGRGLTIPGFAYRCIGLVAHVLPQGVVGKTMEKLYRRAIG